MLLTLLNTMCFSNLNILLFKVFSIIMKFYKQSKLKFLNRKTYLLYFLPKGR